MPYARRNAAGQLDSLHRTATAEASEYVDRHSHEVCQFLGGTEHTGGQFVELDANFVRVIEDMIDILVAKNIINITDLPPQAQAKIIARKSFRERVSQSPLHVLEKNHGGG